MAHPFLKIVACFPFHSPSFLLSAEICIHNKILACNYNGLVRQRYEGRN